MPSEPSFPRVVSLACHDLRTPLATVHGFARTLPRVTDLGEPASRYVEMIERASTQLGELLDDLSLLARIEAGRWEPAVRAVDSLELVSAAAGQLEGLTATVTGTGAPVSAEPEAAGRALYQLVRCVTRHGGLAEVDVRVAAERIEIGPLPPEVAPIALGEELRDLGAVVGGRVVGALGGSVAVDGDRLVVRLPAATQAA